MAEYISKSALVAEIDRRIKERDFQMKRGCWVSSTYMYEDLLDFIDTLEVKEVQEEPISEDLEEAAKFYTATHTEFFDSECKPHVAPAFIAGAKWQKEQMMNNVITTNI